MGGSFRSTGARSPMRSSGRPSPSVARTASLAEQLGGVVAARLESLVSGGGRSTGGRRSTGGGGQPEIPTIEQVQDLVERVLIDAGHARTAKAYILYRERRADARTARTARSQRREAGPSGAPAPLGDEPGDDAPGR